MPQSLKSGMAVIFAVFHFWYRYIPRELKCLPSSTARLMTRLGLALLKRRAEMYCGTPDKSAFFSKNPSEKFHEVLIGATLKQLSQRVLAEIKRTVFVQ